MTKWTLARQFLLAIGLLLAAVTGLLTPASPAKANSGVATLACTPPNAPPEISELARALNYDFNLIYEYVYYNIEHSPTFGLKKGYLSTLLDGSGNNMDQNFLFWSLLKQSCIDANYRYGAITFAANSVANLLGVDNDAALLSRALGNGGIPHCIRTTAGGDCVTSGGAAVTVTIQRLSTQFTVDGATYNLDPSFKSYQHHDPLSAATVDSAIGHTTSSFINAANVGASALGGIPSGIGSVKNVNRANIVSKLNTYSENLSNYIRANKPSNSMKEIFGGRTITNDSYGTNLPATGTLCTTIGACTPAMDALKTFFTVKVSDSPTSAATITKTYQATQISSKRLTLSYNTSSQPVLTLDGTVVATGAATSAPSQYVTMTMSAPYAPAPFDTRTVQSSVKTGGIYSIVMTGGETGRGSLTYHQQKVAKAVASGSAEESEAVLGGGLAIVANAWLSQVSEDTRVVANLAEYIQPRHVAMGIAGYNGSVYVDFPGLFGSVSPKNTSITNSDIAGAFFGGAIRAASLESTTVKQLQSLEAVSTPRIFDYSNSSSIGFIQATQANWGTVKPLLFNWSASEITAMEEFLTESGTSGRQAIIPQDGSQAVDSWVGNGFYLQEARFSSVYYLSLSALIKGNTKGGYATQPADLTSNITSMIKATAQYAYDRVLSWDPIDLGSGNFLYDNEDINAGSQEFPFSLTLKRSYNSGNRSKKTALGYGWRHNFMMSVFRDSDPYEAFGDHNPLAAVTTIVAGHVMKDILRGTSSPTVNNMVAASITASWLMDQLVGNAVTVETNEGTTKFARIPAANGNFTYVPPPGVAATLVMGTGNSATITDKHGITTTFDTDGNIKIWKDKNNNTIDFSYSSAGATKKLASVSNGMGRTLSFIYDASDQLTAVTDGTRTVNYTYDIDGNLTSFENELGLSTTYSYDQRGQMTEMLHPAFPSTAAMTNVYDDFGRVKTQADAFGNVWHYLFANGFTSHEVDPLGNTRLLRFDGKGNVLVDIDQTGARTRYFYDGVGRRSEVTYPRGDGVSLTYDDKSNILTKTTTPVPGAVDPLTGNPATPFSEGWTYTALSKPSTYTDPRGATTSYSYDAGGNLTQKVEPAVPFGPGSATPTTTTTYNSRGLPLTITDPEGKVTAYTYDPTTFDLLTVTDDSGTGRLNLQTAYTYDTIGNRLTSEDPNGNVTTFTYYSNRKIRRKIAPAPFTDSISAYVYNASGQLLREKQSTEDGWLTTQTDYNAAGKPTVATAPDGTTSTTSYDAAGRVSTVTSSSGRRVRYSYDAASRIVQIVDEVSGSLDPSITQNLGSVVRETRTYYTGGLLSTLADGNGNALTYFYDGFGRLGQVKYPDHTSATPNYDLYGYDENGNRRVHQRRDGSQIWWTYDALNRATSKAPTSQPTISYAYDRVGRLLAAVRSSSTTAADVTYIYDTAGRRVGETSGFFGTTTFALDANGNRTGNTLPSSASGLVVANSYDALNRLTAVFQGAASAANRIAGFSYDVAGRRIAASYGPSDNPVASTGLAYTPASLPSSITHNWNGASLNLAYSYNADHQRTGVSASDDTFLLSGYPAATKSYTSNNLNQYSDVSGTVPTYDGRGNLTSDGTWTYTYDTENRLVGAAQSDVSIGYGYDAVGRRMLKTVTENGVTTTTAWLSVGGREMAEYEGVSSLSLKNLFVYGAGLDEPVAQSDAAGLRYYFADALGSTVALANGAGQLTDKYTYSAYGLGKVIGPDKAGFTFAGRRLDRETGLYHNRARAYSAVLGRFLQPDPIGTADNINLYAYVGNDPLNLVDPMGESGTVTNYASNSWDSLSRMPGDIVNIAGDVWANPLEGLNVLDSFPPNPSMAVTGIASAGFRTFGKTAGVLGREGETAVRSMYDIGDKVAFDIAGRTRIPDGFIPGTSLSEVKNVGNLSFTSQLRDYLAIAQQQGVRFDLYARPNTNISRPLQQTIDAGMINRIDIPR